MLQWQIFFWSFSTSIEYFFQGKSLSSVLQSRPGQDPIVQMRQANYPAGLPAKSQVSGKTFTVRDLSQHLEQENIHVGSGGGKVEPAYPPQPTDPPQPHTEMVDRPLSAQGSSLAGDDNEGGRETPESFTPHPSPVPQDIFMDQRACPSPVDGNPNMATTRTGSDDSMDGVIMESPAPGLKSSLQRVGSAKPKGIHVRFADDVKHPESSTDSSPRQQQNGGDNVTFFMTEDEMRGNQAIQDGRQFENEADMEETIEDVFGEDLGEELHLELDPPDNPVHGPPSQSPDLGRPVSRFESHSGRDSVESDRSNPSPENIRMPAPRDMTPTDHMESDNDSIDKMDIETNKNQLENRENGINSEPLNVEENLGLSNGEQGNVMSPPPSPRVTDSQGEEPTLSSNQNEGEEPNKMIDSAQHEDQPNENVTQNSPEDGSKNSMEPDTPSWPFYTQDNIW